MNNSNRNQEKWTLVIKPHTKWYKLDIKNVWNYRDLIFLFVKRDFVSQYKQTILGPLWLFIQPLLQVMLFSIVFGMLAKIPTQGVPRMLFYLSAFVPWTYFTDCFTKSASTFSSNASIFGKVYFPRLVMPISVSISSLYKFGVQFFLFLIVYLFFLFSGYNGHPTLYLILSPILLIFPAIFGLSLGLIVSSLTIKYRDLNFLTGVLIQILMYGSSIVYSISDLDAKYINFLRWNPMVWVMEAFRFSFLGVGVWSWAGLSYALLVMIFLMLLALITFNKTEKNFIDVI